jgi:hypothetical protein
MNEIALSELVLLSKVELLPCPFCGMEPRISTFNDGMNHYLHSVMCDTINCPAVPSFHETTVDRTAAAWNRRATVPAQSEASEGREKRCGCGKYHREHAPWPVGQKPIEVWVVVDAYRSPVKERAPFDLEQARAIYKQHQELGANGPYKIIRLIEEAAITLQYTKGESA